MRHSKNILSAIKRGYSRTDAAEYIGISPSKFDLLVADGRMPKPMQLDRRLIWDVYELDHAFEALSERMDDWKDVV